MATLTVQNIVPGGLAPTYASAAGGGDEFVNNETKTKFLHVKNGGGSSITVTVATQQTVDGFAVADNAVTVGAGAEKMIGDFRSALYNDSNGKVQITYSGVTAVTVAVFGIDDAR